MSQKYKRASWFCNSTGKKGNIVELIKLFYGVEKKSAMKMLFDFLGVNKQSNTQSSDYKNDCQYEASVAWKIKKKHGLPYEKPILEDKEIAQEFFSEFSLKDYTLNKFHRALRWMSICKNPTIVELTPEVAAEVNASTGWNGVKKQQPKYSNMDKQPYNGATKTPPELIDGFSIPMLDTWNKLGVDWKLLAEYDVRETKYHRIAYTGKAAYQYKIYDIWQWVVDIHRNRDENSEKYQWKEYIDSLNIWKRGKHSSGDELKEFVFGWKKLKERIEQKEIKEACIIAKSPKDALVLLAMGFDTIAPMSEQFELPKEIMQKLVCCYKKIVVFYDEDKAGTNHSRERVKELNDLCKESKAVSIYLPNEGRCRKDISDKVYNMVLEGKEVAEAVKTVKAEIEQLISNAKSTLQKEELIDNKGEYIIQKDNVVKNSIKSSRFISIKINDECEQKYPEEFLQFTQRKFGASAEILKELDIWKHKKTDSIIIKLDVSQEFDSNKRKYELFYEFHILNWQNRNSKLTDSPNSRRYLFGMNILYKNLQRKDESTANMPLIIAKSPEDVITIHCNCPNCYVVGTIDENFQFGKKREEHENDMYYITNKFSSATVLDMPQLTKDLNEFAKRNNIKLFAARTASFREDGNGKTASERFMKLGKEKFVDDIDQIINHYSTTEPAPF
ncbi:hypothetical protein [Candidatus Azobacteroides pseudotrichonymphae]|uniref:Toprim domain-containing protein n=1 Tax=Azobacteroides pseudotrichonymphae genomovar. CFP2 TaxID=511995 RepID=B6YRZ0_AZOPC|nr:hypothetical protein [Candidatus Azobacteroides pseudotrichonymphae]BAG83962.1 conserved hypothetical protein [Candidatus Azobacteroides pseudotrichonymphae genomovar. CFP2]